MITESIKNDLRVLAEAQLAFELNGWVHTGSIQRETYSNSSNWGTVFEKGDKKFYLNIFSAPKAIQILRRVP